MLIAKEKVPHGFFCVYNEKPDFDFIQVKQTHSSIVISAQNANHSIEADGIEQKLGTYSLAIKTADCLPVYLSDQHHSAMIHAGWRGLDGNIFGNLSFRPEFCFIGPCIHQESYEVGQEFRNYFPENTLKQIQGKLCFDLRAQAVNLLTQLNPQMIINQSHLNTFSDERLNSFRQNKTEKRNWNLFLPENHLN